MTDRSPVRGAAARGSRAERILRSAAELFATQGFAATPVRQIAEAAGVSQGLLYNHFDGKEGVLRAIFERGMADVRASFAVPPGGGDPADAVESLVRAALGIVRENLPFWRILYQLRMQPDVIEGLAEPVAAWSDEILAHLEGLVRAAGAEDPAIEARVLFAAIDGAAQHLALDPDGYPVEEVAQAMVRRLVPGRHAAVRGRPSPRRPFRS